MSLKTWKAKYYPTPASECKAGLSAVNHSLRKWRGLTNAVLTKHGLTLNGARLIDAQYCWMLDIDGGSCALCVHYAESIDGTICGDCPLRRHLGKRCDETDDMPFRRFSKGGNVQPMIQALLATKFMLLDERTKEKKGGGRKAKGTKRTARRRPRLAGKHG